MLNIKCIRNNDGLIAVAPHRVEIAAENLNMSIDDFLKQEVIELGGGHYISCIVTKEKDHGKD